MGARAEKGRTVEECRGCAKAAQGRCRVVREPAWFWRRYGTCPFASADPGWEEKAREAARRYAGELR